MKILQLIDDLGIGGAQKLLLGFSRAARTRGHHVAVMSLNDSPASPIDSELRSLGIPVQLLGGTGMLDIRRYRALVQFLRRERFDIVHTHLLTSNILGGIAVHLSGTPVVGSLHNTDPWSGRHAKVKQWLEYLILRRWTQRTIAVGHIVAERHVEKLRPAGLDVVPNAVPLIDPLPADERRRLRMELVGDPDRPIVLTLGRLTRQKGYDILLQAFATVHQSHPDACLLIAGSGPDHEVLTALAASLGLNEHARLLGPRSDPERLLGAADIFVSSSRWEGLPLVVLEAMAARLPVVATSVGDIPRVLTENTGLLVPPDDAGALAAELGRLLGDVGLRQNLGQGARARIESEYSVEVWCERLLAVYADVIALGRKGLSHD